MGLFDFFKKKPTNRDIPTPVTPINRDVYVLEAFKRKLAEMGHKAEWHPQYLAIIVNDELEIASLIIDNPNSHYNLLQLLVFASHPEYFPGGIEESLAGIGLTFEQQVGTAVDNYINSTFLTIMHSFSDNHNPELDFMVNANGKDVLWHPKLGNLILQGKWNEQPQHEPLFELLKDLIPGKLTSNKINWLKIYLSKQAGKDIIGECLFNNEPWNEGLAQVSAYADGWKIEGDFKGIKQFIMFRRCDKYDE
jgi:Family of unknown function (DUF6348)